MTQLEVFMKKAFLVLVLFIIGFAVLPAQENPVIIIVNNTGVEVNAVSICKSGTTSWTRYTFTDNKIIGNGQTYSLQLQNPINTVNQYDVIIKTPTGKTYRKNNVKVSANIRIEFTASDIDNSFMSNLDDLFA
jgi:hypothetical protein